jgi:hypothetical protein
MEGRQTMTPDQIKQVIQDGQWVSIYNDMLFNWSKNVDGRAFDKPENRPTNLQIPLVRQQ